MSYPPSPQPGYPGDSRGPVAGEGTPDAPEALVPAHSPFPMPPQVQPARRGDLPPAPKKSRVKAAIIALSIVLVLVLGAGGYLIYLTRAWSDHSAQLDAISQDLGQQVAELSTDLATTQGNLNVATEQLTKAQERITELASEKALVGDDRENQKIIAQDTAQVAREALAVSDQLGLCVTAQNSLSTAISKVLTVQNQVIGELAKDEPNADSLTEYQTALAEASAAVTGLQTDTNTTCKGAIDRYNALLDDLKQE